MPDDFCPSYLLVASFELWISRNCCMQACYLEVVLFLFLKSSFFAFITYELVLPESADSLLDAIEDFFSAFITGLDYMKAPVVSLLILDHL